MTLLFLEKRGAIRAEKGGRWAKRGTGWAKGAEKTHSGGGMGVMLVVKSK
jgi:hypothetical protein